MATLNTLQSSFDFLFMIEGVDEQLKLVKDKLSAIRNRQDALSIGDMFEMQMLMNQLSQFAEMSTNIMSAGHTAVSSMARNVKG